MTIIVHLFGFLPMFSALLLTLSTSLPVSPDLPVQHRIVDAIHPETPSAIAQTQAIEAIDPQAIEDAPIDPAVDPAMAQITSVSQLMDVSPRDWAFQALQSLVERYGCIAGYPDKTYRGDRAMTRYEFAAGLNACLERVNELIAATTADRVKREDLVALQKLQEEFAAELAILRGRVDALEAKVATLEKQQFSTTTRLYGEAIFSLAAAAGGKPPGRGETNLVMTNLVQLQLATAFTQGRDLLRIGLVASNFDQEGFAGLASLNTNMAFLSYQGTGNNSLQLNTVDYRFAVSDRLVLAFQPVGFSLYSVLSANSPYGNAGDGAISRFAALNPILRIGNLDAGVGLDWLISNKWRLQVAYGVRNASSPDAVNGSEGGLFNSGHQALGMQLLYRPSVSTIWGFAYINAYADDGQLDTFTGSSNADTSGGFNQPAKIHALAGSFQWRVSPQVTLGAWGGLVLTDSTFGEVFRAIRDRDLDLEDLGTVTLSSTYLVSLGINDPFGRKGDQLVFMAGHPPKLNLGVLIERVDFDNSFHFEAFYRYRVNDRISITPGFFYVTNPGHIAENKNIFVGSIRTTFRF
ncbi:MAG: iron uptake porin [Synechococcales bacterium]|nr:iron uptake porin [Synechococcales bacterium]